MQIYVSGIIHVDISSLMDLEEIGYLEIKFALATRRNIRRIYQSTGQAQPTLIPGPTNRTLDITATYKWSARVIDKFSLSLSEDTAEFLSKTWPETLQQLQTMLMLGGASDVWIALEDHVVGRYNLYNKHQGELANVRN
jgi:hypothetical protein